MTIISPDREQVLLIHQDQIARYGGDSAVRDLGLLDSAIAQPLASFGGQWLHEFPHPFVDGNKRTAFATSLAFLDFNEYELRADREGAEELVLAVAQGKVTKEAVTQFFSDYVRPKSPA